MRQEEKVESVVFTKEQPQKVNGYKTLTESSEVELKTDVKHS